MLRSLHSASLTTDAWQYYTAPFTPCLLAKPFGCLEGLVKAVRVGSAVVAGQKPGKSETKLVKSRLEISNARYSPGPGLFTTHVCTTLEMRLMRLYSSSSLLPGYERPTSMQGNVNEPHKHHWLAGRLVHGLHNAWMTGGYIRRFTAGLPGGIQNNRPRQTAARCQSSSASRIP